MGQNGKVGESAGRLSEAEFHREVREDQARENRLSWWQLGIMAGITGLAFVREWINS